jgi:predicted AlkP superfamily pyrophosphatase or phosphodiesterase
LGEFPFPTFWGPAAGVQTPQGSPEAASRWIAESAKWVENKYHPTLSLVYLPHLDYNLQRLGPDNIAEVGGKTEAVTDSFGMAKINPQVIPDLQRIDKIVGELLDFFEKRSVQVILLSEYGITQVNWPIHLNRLFRKEGWLEVKDELGLEILNCGASKVFAVADHQIAHIYLNDLSLETAVRKLLQAQTGVEQVLGQREKEASGINHPRAGDLVAVAAENAWFTYYYWLEDRLAPDFARTVDIHRKPGYDPVELFLDPSLKHPKLRIVMRLLQKKAGFRMLMDVIPLDALLVRGSHGRIPKNKVDYPVLISSEPRFTPSSPMEPTDVYHVVKRHILG